MLLAGRLAPPSQRAIRARIDAIAGASPFRRYPTRRGGAMSVAMTNCGPLGWVSDRSGYRYDPVDPLTGTAWPPMPDAFARLARDCAAEAGYASFEPDCCLINRYEPGSALSPHRDLDERDADAPIVSISLDAPATFLWGDTPSRIGLAPGDVVVFGGASRFVRHGIARLGKHAPVRLNLTFRRTGRSARSAP